MYVTPQRPIVGVVLAAATLASAHATTVGMAPQLRKDAECMFRVLKTVPGVDHVKLGASSYQNWIHPYLEYRATADETGYRQVIRYDAERACTVDNPHNCCSTADRDYCFVAILSGLTASGTEPSDWGTRDIDRKWKSACGVTALGYFE
jgi:hypothetical protein